MPRKHRITALTVTLMAATLINIRCAAPGPPAGAGPAPGTLYLHPERILLQDGSLASADRGQLFVPVKRSDPRSGIISIEIYRFKARGGIQSPPIFLLHGGPSFQGLAGALAEPGFYERSIRPYLEAGDLVVVGQRGIGSSKPDTVIEAPGRFPADQEVTEQEAAEALREACAQGKAFWESQGLDLTGLTVLEAAADVVDVRKALGYDKITLWGGSFGSHWGMAVMRYHPEIVERAVLRGMEGPDHTYDMPSYVLHSLERIAGAADQSPRLQGLIPEGGLLAAFKTVIARAQAGPIRTIVKDANTGEDQAVVLTARSVREMALGYTATVSSRRGMRSWPADVLALYREDYSRAATAVLERRQARSGPTAGFFMLDCASGITPDRKAQIQQDPAVEILGPIGWMYDVGCPVWDIDLGNEFRKNFETTIPTLIVQGTWDVSTPMENALELAPFFKTSKLILVHGGSHGALQDAMDLSVEFRAAVMKFARSGDMSDLPDEVTLPDIEWEIP
ncbi:MAG: alpha/beta fold hydrolase [Acidobacteria bacterium]|nr:alpha/beta fold hydrolase [Acidobacteriota bacterium]